MPPSTINRSIIALNNPKSPASEAYRGLRTNILFSAVDQAFQVIMLTSAGTAEGKSTTTANLAVTYAQAGQKVLILDCDLRKPVMHRIFGLSNRFGMSNALAGQVPFREVIRDTEIPNLSVITAGPTPPNPSEMLMSNRMKELVEELRSEFDIMIVDTPPALALTDAQIVATLCDGVLLVLESGRVKREAAIKVRQALEHVNAKIIGAVLNKVSKKANSYYQYYYAYGEE